MSKRETKVASESTPLAPTPTGPRKFRCHLAAASPVEHQNVEIEAESAEQAKKLFYAMNGIDHSDHPFTATPV